MPGIMEAWVKWNSSEYRNGWDRTFGRKDPSGTTCPDEEHDLTNPVRLMLDGVMKEKCKCRRCHQHFVRDPG